MIERGEFKGGNSTQSECECDGWSIQCCVVVWCMHVGERKEEGRKGESRKKKMKR